MARVFNTATFDNPWWDMVQSIYLAFNCVINNQVTENALSHNPPAGNGIVCLRNNNIQSVNEVSAQIHDQAVGGADDERAIDDEETNNESGRNGKAEEQQVDAETEMDARKYTDTGGTVDSSGEVNTEEERDRGIGIHDVEENLLRITTRARRTYELDQYKRNAALIFIQITNNCERKKIDQTIHDLALVIFSLTKFRYEVDIYFNLPCYNIDAQCKEFFQKDFSKYGSVMVMVLSSYGRTSHLMASDNMLNESAIIEHFTTNLPSTLRCKPKIYITEATRDVSLNRDQLSTRISGFQDILAYDISSVNSSSGRPIKILFERILKYGEDHDLATIFDDAKQETGQLKFGDMEIQIGNTLNKEVRLAKIIPHTGNVLDLFPCAA